MALTRYTNGVESFGVPVIGSGQIPTTTGSYFFVDSSTGSAGNDGTSPTSALNTVDNAVNKCTANKGDVIVCMPGHAETISSATSLVLDVAGVTVIGLGTGNKRPTFTYATSTAASVVVSADNVTVANCRFIGNLDNVAAAFTLGAAKYFELRGNDFIDNSAALHFITILVTGTTDNAVDGLRVVGNRWWGLALAPNAFISILGDTDLLYVADNLAVMAVTDDEGHFITITADTLRAAEITRNKLICTGSTGAAVGIFLTGSSTDNTGIVSYNLVSSLDTTAELIATAGTGLTFIENYYTGTADASGKLWPAVDGA